MKSVMSSKTLVWGAFAALLAAAACDERTSQTTPGVGPSFAMGGEGRPVVLVNPNAQGNGTANTIQEGINLVAAGGRVMVKPGTYAEAIVVDKGITIEGIDLDDGPVVIEQALPGSVGSGEPAVILVTTPDPVVIRNLTVHHVFVRALNALRIAADLTVEHVSFLGEFPGTPAAFFNNGVSVVNNAAQSGGRAKLVVRDSYFDVFGIAISLGGDIDALVEGNTLHHTASNSGCVFVSPTGQGVTVAAGAVTNVDIMHNEFVDCGASVTGKVAAGILIQGVPGATTTGVVNVLGNTIRNTVRVAPSCNTGAILYEFYTGRIERNTIVNATPQCAVASNRAFPGAIFVGSRVAAIRRADVTVRLNDIYGNAFAGLRIGVNQTVPLDATCNWWGAADGPSGTGPGTGDALLVEAGGAAPSFTPFATAPIAATDATGC